MIKKKKKKRRTKKARHTKTFFALTLAAGSILVLAISYFIVQSGSTHEKPVFEEVYSLRSDLSRKIAQIDSTIYECLYQGGISTKRVSFLNVKSKIKGSNGWEFTGLLIRLPDQKSIAALEKQFRATLDKRAPDVAVKTHKTPKGETVYDLYALGLNTHRLRLKQDSDKGREIETMPRLAIIVDDLGYDSKIARAFMALDIPLTLSLLPIAPQTERIVGIAKEKGYELMLHLPMEPKDYPRINPGPGVLLKEMGEREIRRTLKSHLETISGAKGVNNHMGSRFTQDREKMEIVLSELKKSGLYYIDSRTTAQTVAFNLAKRLGIKTAKRNVFLDNSLSANSIEFQMERLLGIAGQSGQAIGIVHPHRTTLEVVKKYLPRLKEGFKVVPASELVG